MQQEAKLIIFTAPSGAGKTTIVKHLLKTRKDLAFSISACTRSQRYGEVNGMDYYFLSLQDFKRRIEADEFVEWEEVYENQFYGTLKEEVERLLALGKSVLFDIDVKGAVNIQKHYPERSLSIFVKPPSADTLFARLRGRKTEDEESLRKRIARASDELTYECKFDYTLVNDNLEVALAEAEKVAEAFISEGNSGLEKLKHGNGHHA
ncbi:guanylate kinase [Saprospira grandis DSM 2844]|uniref:Guanylate kinase n=1 Tax=Saprospira grandis DSM 2844 TaxID=694433 RepID=J1I824_9BACT|nr:guanylate kinase [Saprospira grandis]EJF54980.1 guanylate kinase [Saprospira grandis DSM 2844]